MIPHFRTVVKKYAVFSRIGKTKKAVSEETAETLRFKRNNGEGLQ